MQIFPPSWRPLAQNLGPQSCEPFFFAAQQALELVAMRLFVQQIERISQLSDRRDLIDDLAKLVLDLIERFVKRRKGGGRHRRGSELKRIPQPLARDSQRMHRFAIAKIGFGKPEKFSRQRRELSLAKRGERRRFAAGMSL